MWVIAPQRHCIFGARGGALVAQITLLFLFPSDDELSQIGRRNRLLTRGKCTAQTCLFLGVVRLDDLLSADAEEERELRFV
jgi:hypothetical protein